MLIHRLILSKYIRLKLREIDYFEYRPAHVHQLIIGGNGSGKSSVMHELSPLPGFSGDYAVGGYKVIELTHGNCDYVLKSEFKERSGRHSFMCGDEEMNPGGTGAVQKLLVEQHFGLTEALFEVMIGESRFTDMAPLKRRDWIIALSGCDLDFAMGLFAKLKQQVNESKAIVKHVNRRLTDEQNKALPVDQLELLQTRCATLKDELHYILEHMETGLLGDREAWGRVSEQMSVLTELGGQLLGMDLTPPVGYAFTDLESIQATATVARTEIAMLKTRLAELHVEYAELSRVIAMMGQDATDIVDLENRYRRLQGESKLACEGIVDWYRQSVPLDEAERLYGVMDALYPQLHGIYSEMPDNSDRRYTREIRDATTAKRIRLSEDRDRCAVGLGKIEHMLSHLRSADSQTCPKCTHTWRPGVGRLNEQEMIESANDLTAQSQDYIRQIAECDEYLDRVTEYMGYRRSMTQAISGAPAALKCVWQRIVELESTAVSPRAVLVILDEWRRAAEQSLTAYRLSKEIDQVSAVIAYMQGHQSSDNANVRYGRMGAEIESLTQRIETTQLESQLLGGYESQVTRYLAGLPKMASAIVEFDARYMACLHAIRNAHLTGMMSERQSSLAHSEVALSTAKSVVDVIADLEADVVRATASLYGYTSLMAELSPVDGLIADQLKDFIKTFTDEMNGVIDRIWTSPLVIQPCGMDSGELDWKFPLRAGADGLSADVSKASKGQREIVDFAFKLVVILYLGLNNMPLYLDELAPALDEQHRNNIMVFVKQYVEARQCTQLIMISHYNEAYGMFSNAEVCVLDPTNIVHMPECINQHVIIR